jgi:hypothetical protein
MTRAASLHARLPRLDPASARAQTAMVGALVGAGVEVLRADAAMAPRIWIACVARGPQRAWLAPRLVGGMLAPLTADDGKPCAVAAMQALGALEPLVQRIEQAWGISLLPDTLSGPPAGHPIEVGGGDPAAPDRLWLAAEGLAPSGFSAPARHRLPAACRLPLAASIRAAPLHPALLGDLGAGALLLLGVGPHVGAVAPGLYRTAALPPATGHPARFDLAARHIELLEPSGDPMASDDPALPVLIRIDGADMPLSAAAGLGPGSVIELPAAGPTLAVTVLVGGAAIARGDLVAVGEGFGVLVTARLGA